MGGGKRGPNADLNLVPFIDLFSTLICFLLLTASYQELEQINTGAPPTMTQQAPDNNPEPPPPPEKKVQLSVSLLMDRLELAEDEKITKIPYVGAEPDYAALKDKLLEWRTKYPARKDLVLNTDSHAPYKSLIGLMDTMLTSKFSDVGINLN